MAIIQSYSAHKKLHIATNLPSIMCMQSFNVSSKRILPALISTRRPNSQCIILWRTRSPWATAFSPSGFHDHTQAHHTRQNSSGRVINPTQRIRTTDNTHNRHTSMTPAGFEPAIPTTERPQTHTLHCAATGMGLNVLLYRMLTSQCKSGYTLTLKSELESTAYVTCNWR